MAKYISFLVYLHIIKINFDILWLPPSTMQIIIGTTKETIKTLKYNTRLKCLIDYYIISINLNFTEYYIKFDGDVKQK